MHNVFISYHHARDQHYKEALLKINKNTPIFIDKSVDTNEIDDNLPDDKIRELIRDEYLKESTVTILLVGTETKKRKHIDWEIYSSMYNGLVNKKSGILVVNINPYQNGHGRASHDGEKEKIYPNITFWKEITTRSEYESTYPYMPARIIDNFLEKDVRISVIDWDIIEANPFKLALLIDMTHNEKNKDNYNLSREMKRNNS